MPIMKKQAIIFIIFCITVLLSSYRNSVLSVDLVQAIQEKKVRVDITSTGGYSGKCISMKIENLSNIPMYVGITPGTLFIPGDEGEQTLVTIQSNVIVLQKAESKTVLVSGYCTELSDRCPASTTTFTAAKSSNIALADLARLMAPYTNLEDGFVQQAVWCITDSQSVSNVSGSNVTASKAVREYLFKQTGQTDTWYQTRRIPEMTADRNIVNTAAEVKGKIEFKATKTVELQSVVENEAGEVVWTYPYKTSLPAGDIVFDFGLKVRNWKKGNYYIIYTCEGKELVNQKFTI